MPSNDLPLSGITVLDVTLARAGPTCVRHLADWGANVIRIERPKTAEEDVVGSREGPDFQNLHRNKRMITLDLKTSAGHQVFMQLAKKCDVIVENMRASVKDRLKIGWHDVNKVNPRIVYGSISGFGQSGPYANRAGVDQIVQGMGGLMSVTGLPGQGPVRAGVAVADLTAGNLLALAIVMALFHRERTGVGRWVHTSLLESQIFMLDFQAARYLIRGEVAGQMGNDHPTGVPTGVYPTKDGLINIGASGVWQRFCDAIGKPQWKEREEWKDQAGRYANRNSLNASVSEITRTNTSAHWLKVFDVAGVPSGPINTIDMVFADPQVQHLGIAAEGRSDKLGRISLVASPLNFENVEKKILNLAPGVGADTMEVLTSFGFSEAEVRQLAARGVV